MKQQVIICSVLLMFVSGFSLAQNEVVSDGLVQEKFIYDDHAKRDPFWPLVSRSGTMISYEKEISIKDLILEGIISDAEGNLAIINGNIVKKGDTVGIFTIETIGDYSITLTHKSKNFTLHLNKEE